MTKKVSKVARGKRSKVAVWHAWKGKAKTTSGKTKKDMKKDKEGKIVYKKKPAQGEKAFSNIAKWVAATKKAREVLGLKGFAAMKKGTGLYSKTREFYESDTLAPHKLLRRASSGQP